MSKLPSFQFYPADWRKDPAVQSLGYFERGVWIEILCLMHESEFRGKLLLNGRPMPADALARLLGLDKQKLQSILTTFIDYGVASLDEDGALVSRRMVRDEYIRQVRAEAGRKGGNPNLLKQKRSKTQAKAEQIPTPSSSSSTSKQVDIPRPREPDFSGFANQELAIELEETFEWLRTRKQIAHLPEQEWLDLFVELEREGIDLNGFRKFYTWCEDLPWRTGAVKPGLMRSQIEDFKNREALAVRQNGGNGNNGVIRGTETDRRNADAIARIQSNQLIKEHLERNGLVQRRGSALSDPPDVFPVRPE